MKKAQFVNNGCEICKKPAKWQAVFCSEDKFGFPYVFARTQIYEAGYMRVNYCPVCGRSLKEESDNG